MSAALVVSLAGPLALARAQAPAPAPAAPRSGQAPAAPRGGPPPATPRGGQPPTAERGEQPPARGAATPPARGAATPPARGAATPPGGYKYDPSGRRDPFRDLLAPGTNTPLTTSKAVEGLAGLSVNDITVRGVLQTRGAFIAMVQAPDKKTYVVHQGDKFLDGTVRSVTPQGLVIVQEVRDPLSLLKEREIRKQLRSAEGAKP